MKQKVVWCEHIQSFSKPGDPYVPVPALVDFPHTITYIAGGHDHTLILTDEGDVFGFGPSEFIGVASEDIDRNSKIQKLNLPSKAVWISAGYHHSLAVTDQGEVFAFGTDIAGSLQALKAGSTLIRPVKLPGFGSGENEKFALKAAAETIRSAILTRGNEVHSLPTSLDREFTSNVCKVPEGENIIDIGCAEADVYFSTDVGSVYHSNRQKMKRVSIPEDLPITKLETRGSVVTLLAGHPKWTFRTHRQFPKPFREQVRTLLLCAQIGPGRLPRHLECGLWQLPKELLFLVIHQLAESLAHTAVFTISRGNSQIVKVETQGHEVADMASSFSECVILTDRGEVLSTFGVNAQPDKLPGKATKIYAGSYTFYAILEE